uniref:spore germination protein n=1 Tax=Agathobacter sp. TaxID=2021311 RepID=UPI004057447D
MSSKKQPITVSLAENETAFRSLFSTCDDVKYRKMNIGKHRKVTCLIAYIEVSLSNTMLEKSALGRMIAYLEELPENEINHALKENATGLSDAAPIKTMEEAAMLLLTGSAILFVDGYPGALKISDKGYPGLDVGESDTEKVVRGSDESFTESEKINTALIRKRIRSTRLKVKEFQAGIRSHTNVAIVYIEDLADKQLVEETHRRLTEYEIDGVLDSGVMEQLAEEKWYSPFPQFHSTRRPDRAAMSVLEGKVVVIVDNSPVALLLPADLNSFLKTTDDYYNRFHMATFARLLRYVSAFFALTLPGLYLAVTNFHTQILPTPLLLSFQEARTGVPFPAALEVLLMELSFELLREAGVRLPGAMGNTIGIVGGLIIGQSAVEANLVSPIVVIVVAFTALCSFAIPNEEFAFSFRILKFYIIFLSAWLGYFGFLVGLFSILVHIARLKSFDTPYLTPYVDAKLNGYQDEKDSFVRFPLRLMWKRPIYSNPNERTKLKKKE